jgi:hypothetical protein
MDIVHHPECSKTQYFAHEVYFYEELKSINNVQNDGRVN